MSKPNEPASTGPPGLPISPFCSKLRSKKYYFLEGPALTEEDILDASNDCWCGRTMQRVGPDGKVVDPSDCVVARDCHETI